MAPDILADPETDPTATYAVEPALVRRLTARVTCAGAARASALALRWRPAGVLPLSTSQDVVVAVDAAGRPARVGARPSSCASGSCCATTTSSSTGRSQLLDLVQLESGKTRRQAFEELADVALVARHYARGARTTCGAAGPECSPC